MEGIAIYRVDNFAHAGALTVIRVKHYGHIGVVPTIGVRRLRQRH